MSITAVTDICRQNQTGVFVVFYSMSCKHGAAFHEHDRRTPKDVRAAPMFVDFSIEQAARIATMRLRSSAADMWSALT